MPTVAPANSTYAYIERKIRRLTASSSESSLPTASIQEYVNNFYNQNFPNTIKTDQMRSVYTFYTQPYIDRYPVDVNYNQGFRSPMYVDGIEGTFAKDREQFFLMWPKWPTLSQPIAGDGVTQQFSFTIGSVPFLRGSVTLGGVDATGAPIQVRDDGNGNLQYLTPNAQVSVPAQNTSLPLTAPIPGMLNLNTGNPGLNAVTNIGSVNYVTGAFTIDFSLAPGGNVAPESGQTMKLFVSQYTTGRPYSLLFWNNEFTIRPIPKLVHKIEIEAYLTPVQFMLTTDTPILNQWAKYIAYGAAIDILFDRQDFQGVQGLQPAFDYEEGLVLERQASEEIGQRNSTIFSSSVQGQGNYYGSWGYWG
jgi:hypothetical protein